MKTDSLTRMLRDMLLARAFEERAAEEYTQGNIAGFLHLYPGEEAVAVGVLHAAEPADYIVTTYREHVHALVRGIPANVVMAELFGKKTGCSGGMGGSMHLFDRERRFMGGYAIVGETFPVATGIAYAIALRELPEAVICFFGDGAVNQGTFHESLNMAALWKLPVLFVCENNLYGIGTRIERSTSELDQYKRVCGYNIPAQQVDGQDLRVVYRAACEAVDYVRGGNGPYFLELLTYRFRGHSMSDSNVYRTKEEEKEWNKRDPVLILRDTLIEEGHLTVDEFNAMDREIINHIEDDIIKFAEESPEPPVEELEKYVLAENDPYVKGGPH